MKLITRDEVMAFFRQDEFEDNVYLLSEEERKEIMITLSQSINESMEELIDEAIERWEFEHASY